MAAALTPYPKGRPRAEVLPLGLPTEALAYVGSQTVRGGVICGK